MAKKNRSALVMAQRHDNYDRFNVLIRKGGNNLLRVIALREGISTSEMVRRAVLAHAGLKKIPSIDDLNALNDVTTQKEASRAIKALQNREVKTEILQHLQEAMQDNILTYKIYVDQAEAAEYAEAFKNIEYAVKVSGADANEPAVISRRDIGRLRRFLANIEPDETDVTQNIEI